MCDVIYSFSPNEQDGGGGGALPDDDFFFCSAIFPVVSCVQQTTGGFGHRLK